MLIVGILDAAGIASIFPFFTLISNPELIEENRILNFLYGYYDYDSINSFLIDLGLLVFIIFTSSILLKVIYNYIQLRYALLREFTISKRFLKQYLNLNYAELTNAHSAQFSKTILSEINSVVVGALLPTLNLVANIFIAAGILFLLFYINFIVTSLLIILVSVGYVVIYTILRGRVKNYGRNRFEANQRRYEIILETFRNIKEIKLYGIERKYYQDYSISAYSYASNHAKALSAAQLPRYFIEIILFGGLILFLILSLKTDGEMTNIMPLLGVFAMAGYRLLPSLNAIYSAISRIKFMERTIETLHREVQNFPQTTELRPVTHQRPKLQFECIELCDVSFKYPSNEVSSISNLDLKINTGDFVAFVGKTGSGKSTLMDLIAGLLSPTNGQIKINDISMSDDMLHDWSKVIGYVPQEVGILNRDLRENVVFHFDDQADDKTMLSALADADLLNLDIDKGCKTLGEAGNSLSGGQKQRVGLARAFYRDPRVLLLDESTSALDMRTEAEIMQAVLRKRPGTTIIMIAHRPSTIKYADKVILLDKGRIIDTGTYSEIEERHPKFATLSHDVE